MTIYEAINSDKEETDLLSSEGRFAADFVYSFPPDVPLLIPGEEITKEIIEQIRFFSESGAKLRGLRDGRVTVTV